MNGSLCTPQRIVGLLRPAGHVIAVAIALSATVLLSACASPVEGLWPPSPDSPARTIFVSLDTWHAMIAFPMEQAAISDQPPAVGFESRPSTQHSELSTRLRNGAMPSAPGIWKEKRA